MSLFKRRKPGQAVVAAVADADAGDAMRVAAVSGNTQRWQVRAWTLYDQLSVIRKPANYKSAALGRFHFGIGLIDPAKSPTEPIEPTGGDRTDLVRAAEEILASISGPQGNFAGLCAAYGINQTVAADCYLIGTDLADGTTEWEILSVRELVPSQSRPGTWMRVSPVTGAPVDGFNPTVVKRFYKRHPAFAPLADGPLQSLISDCETLLTLERSLRSRFLNRAAQSGIMKIPNTAQIVGAEVAAGDGQGIANAFMKKVLTGSRAQNETPGLNSAVPIGIVAPPADLAAVEFLTMDRTIDRVEMELRSEYRHNIAVGMDLPPEAQEGIANLTRVSTWSISDDTYASYLLPTASDFASDFTAAIFRSLLADWVRFVGASFTQADIDRIVIVADGRSVINRPNEAEDFRQLNDRAAVSDKSLRTHSGGSDDDAPTEEEYLRILGRQAHIPYLATWGMEIHDKVDWDKVDASKAGPGTPGAGGTPTSKRPVDSSTRPQDPKATAELLAAAASGFMVNASKTVGAKIRARAEQYPGMLASIKDHANQDVLANIDLAEIGLTEDEVREWYSAALRPAIDVLGPEIDEDAAERFLDRVASVCTSERDTMSLRSLQRCALRVLGGAST